MFGWTEEVFAELVKKRISQVTFDLETMGSVVKLTVTHAGSRMRPKGSGVSARAGRKYSQVSRPCWKKERHSTGPQVRDRTSPPRNA